MSAPSSRNLGRGLKTAMLSLAMGITARSGSARKNYRNWPDYGGAPDSSHFLELNQIDKSNLSQLNVAWVYPTGDDHAYLFNPIVVDNVMYALARNSSLVALDAVTGKEIWIHENLPGLSTRGIAYWESRDRKDRRLIFAINDDLREIDARTGNSILTLGKNGLVELRQSPAKVAVGTGIAEASTIPGNVHVDYELAFKKILSQFLIASTIGVNLS